MRSPRDKLVRFGVAMEESLLGELDQVVLARGSTRSEAIRDLARGLVSKSKARSGVDAVAALTLVYDHHVRDLTNTLTEMQHELGDRVRSTLHVHLTHDLCMEVIVFRGRADELQAAADRILGARGVMHGGIEIVAMGPAPAPRGRATATTPHAHPHEPPARTKRRSASPSRRA